MAYNRNNHLKKIRYAVGVYNEHKHDDLPDTYIIRVIFPKHNIHIAYRTWMNWKGTPQTNSTQLQLFPS